MTQNQHPQTLPAESSSRAQRLRAREQARRFSRAELAGFSVQRMFVHRLMGIPGTLIADPSVPAPEKLRAKVTDWNYWWQAHLVDALVDAAHRELEAGRTTDARRRLQDCERFLLGIRAHNFGTWVNSYYDDMAWLVLAAGRVNELSRILSGKGSERAQAVGRQLFPQLEEAVTEDLGGGAFWSKAADFKNVPATAPTALAFARAGRHAEARELLDWLRTTLYREGTGYADGVKIELQRDGSTTTRVEENFYPYNQGTVLGAVLATEGADLAHAETLVQEIARTQTEPFQDGDRAMTPLKARGTRDGGLFTGILGRYLAVAARDQRLSEQTRETARALVTDTADLLWDGRREFDPDLDLSEPGVDVNEIRGDAVAFFSTDPVRPASETLKAGARVDLSAQVQAWTLLEAAVRL